MMSLAVGKTRSLVFNCLLGVFVLGLLTGASVLLTPGVAAAQDEEVKAPEKTNPIAHTIKAMFNGAVATLVTLTILAISVGMVALVIILLLDMRLGEAVPPAFVEEFTEMVNKRQFKQAYELCRNESTFVARVLTAGMGRLQYGIEDAREAMAAMNDSVKSSKDSWVSYLGVIGTLGPLLGLVGTVSGMIGAFQKLGEVEVPKPSELAAEISSALVLTLMGVFIAVPAIFFFTFFKNRLTNIAVNVSNLADDLLTQMYHNSKKAAGGAAVTAEATSVRAK